MNTSFFILILLLTFSIIASIASLTLLIHLLFPILAGGGPYVPSSLEEVQIMIQLAEITDRDHVADLGSGDGRVVIAAAQAGARHCVGYEIYPSLVRTAYKNIAEHNLGDRVHIKKQSMWDADLSGISVVFLFQIPYALDRIKKLLEIQLPPGTRIISNSFKIPGWEPNITKGTIHLYTIKDAS
ncbi:class I SAM-dependent methyltransferase [Candidatus Uhrbacteria bacterium]|nr:class I SAM-dependent methyltransferase [Candidatus Uhrbacteria bacterium]